MGNIREDIGPWEASERQGWIEGTRRAEVAWNRSWKPEVSGDHRVFQATARLQASEELQTTAGLQATEELQVPMGLLPNTGLQENMGPQESKGLQGSMGPRSAVGFQATAGPHAQSLRRSKGLL